MLVIEHETGNLWYKSSVKVKNVQCICKCTLQVYLGGYMSINMHVHVHAYVH